MKEKEWVNSLLLDMYEKEYAVTKIVLGVDLYADYVLDIPRYIPIEDITLFGLPIEMGYFDTGWILWTDHKEIYSL